MGKEKIIDKVKLENIIDDYLINDVPLSLLTEKYALTFPQMQLLLNRTRGFARQNNKLRDILGDCSTEEYSENYLVIPHEITEKYPLKNNQQIALFKRLEELTELINQSFDITELEETIASLEEILSQYDKDKINKIESFIKELDNREEKTGDELVFLMCKYGITPQSVQEYNDFYNSYLNILEKLTIAKQELLRKKTEHQNQKSYKTEYENIREELVVRNIKLVNWCIRRFFNNIPLPKDETQLFGIEGLVRAINGFDYKMNFQFSTYAVPTIVHHIERHFSELYGMDWRDFIAKESIKYYRRLMREEDPERTLDATPSELADTGLINLSARQIASYDEMIDIILPNADVYEPFELDLKATKKNEMPISFEDYETIDEYEDKTSIPYDSTDEEELDLRALKKDIDRALSTLTDREQNVLIMHYGLKDNSVKKLDDIGAVFNVTRERVRQIEAKALRRLRHPSRARILKSYLGYDENNNRKVLSYNDSSREIRLMKLIQLLGKNISRQGVLIFMNFENLNLNYEDLDNEVLRLKEILEIAKDTDLSPSEFKERLYGRKYIEISLKSAKYICENYELILFNVQEYVNKYIPSENSELKKRKA